MTAEGGTPVQIVEITSKEVYSTFYPKGLPITLGNSPSDLNTCATLVGGNLGYICLTYLGKHLVTGINGIEGTYALWEDCKVCVTK